MDFLSNNLSSADSDNNDDDSADFFAPNPSNRGLQSLFGGAGNAGRSSESLSYQGIGVDVMITIFCDFRQFSAKKLAFFSKTNVMIKILHILALF
jgi:hypothetical protein